MIVVAQTNKICLPSVSQHVVQITTGGMWAPSNGLRKYYLIKCSNCT